MIASHGPNYLEKLFGNKARDALEPLGGVDKVAITLSGNYRLKFKVVLVIVAELVSLKLEVEISVKVKLDLK